MKAVSNEKIFVDTNILFYANNPSEPFGLQAIERIDRLAASGNELFISGQIIREYAVATIRNAQYHKLPMDSIIQKVLANITVFRSSFTVLHETEDNLEQWIGLIPKLTTSKDVFDFNIAALLKSEEIKYILTHNVRDFEKFSHWLTIIPLME